MDPFRGWIQGKISGEGKGYPLQYSGLENSMDCTVHGAAKSQTQLSDFHSHTPTNTVDGWGVFFRNFSFLFTTLPHAPHPPSWTSQSS